MATKSNNSESSLQAYGLQSMRVNHILSYCKSPRQVLVSSTVTDEDAEAQVNWAKPMFAGPSPCSGLNHEVIISLGFSRFEMYRGIVRNNQL